MPEFMRVKWRDSGTEQSIAKPVDPAAIDTDAYEVLDEDAVDYNGRVLDPVIPSAPTLEDRTVEWLKSEIASRNQGRDEADQIPTQGNKPDLIKAIEADDNKGSDI
ncbi:hypothetical protein J2X46_002698 [Nocardioides sp. BE266]|uniref:hypothetical protein n=1 Tax=Nocardioides sp. BE266 TaxID=2817725 RepID=UPI0028658B6D|nr:hypothetical protein [Nocardioides sp. BE266]MDR7253708.1 hypothetical protein [Nocardioides sp. BE266]